MPGDAAGAWGESAEFLTGSAVSLRLRSASPGAPAPFTCSSDSLPMVLRGHAGRAPKSSSDGRGLQSRTEKHSQGCTVPSTCPVCFWGQIVLGSAIKGLTRWYWQALGLSFPTSPLALAAAVQGGVLL